MIKKVILDTDIGDDIDDAFALALLLKSEEIELLGVTTVFRNTLKRALMAKHLIKMYNKDVKVYAGCDDPLEQDVDKLIPKEIKEKEVLDEYGKYLIPQYLEEMNSNTIEKQNGVDFIIESVKKYPHEVILVAIGPLTNIAMALQKDPSIIPLIKEIRIMGGWLKDSYAEWNIFCDPEAASLVYSSGVKLYCVGLDCTLLCKLEEDDLEQLKQNATNSCSLICQMMDKWFKHYEFKTPIMHDPLCISTLLGDYCEFTKMKMKVNLTERRGFTEQLDDGTEVFVSTKVDVQGFFKLFKQRLFDIK